MQDRVVIITVATLVALVVGVALLLGKRLEIKSKLFSVLAGNESAGDGRKSISVGEGLDISQAEVADISAVKAEGGAARLPEGDTAVLRNAKIRGSTIGDISGLKSSGGKVENKTP